MTPAEHPFAGFIRALGKGPQLARHLTEAEAYEAGKMVMAGAMEPIQLGAFLCLMRVMGETPEELAGLVRAARESLARAPAAPKPDLDWPAYAGKKNRLPWFLLSALMLGGAGIRVLMHGGAEHTSGRQFTETALAALGVAPARSADEASAQLAARGFAYLPLAAISPRLGDLLTLKPVIGLRSPYHTVAKALNPFDAPAQIIGVAHPPYRPLHQQAAARIGQKRLAVFKGDGGEAERRPEKLLEVSTLADGATGEECWPALLEPSALPHEDPADFARLRAVWSGQTADPIAEAMIAGTAAIALRALGRSETQSAAEAEAASIWRARDKGALKGAA